MISTEEMFAAVVFVLNFRGLEEVNATAETEIGTGIETEIVEEIETGIVIGTIQEGTVILTQNALTATDMDTGLGIVQRKETEESVITAENLDISQETAQKEE
jgi:hypothetical protein